MVKRVASHAGSWYTNDGPTLSGQLSNWLHHVPEFIEGAGSVPIPNARIIIAPHAGYSYSGPAAAWAYKTLDLSKAKRVFLLGPSHHMYLSGCALSQCSHYSTPLGELTLDSATIEELHSTGKFEKLAQSADEDEHSLEMHLPYIYKALTDSFPDEAILPKLIPILVGSTNATRECDYGAILAPYLADPSSLFVVSSDFCHWGSRFNYTYYLPSSANNVADGQNLRRTDKTPKSPEIHESIARLDKSAMDAIESGGHDAFLANLRDTSNTVCGRHPIGVVMAALEVLQKQGKISDGRGRFKFVRYERSSDCMKAQDSSVSYASAFALL
ncbi:hypothetical protein MMC09_002225 [Bachmanniomyces sp. S44760]|nr:hypothetical protein [Bachmanniomyces sp. S44760]